MPVAVTAIRPAGFRPSHQLLTADHVSSNKVNDSEHKARSAFTERLQETFAIIWHPDWSPYFSAVASTVK